MPLFHIHGLIAVLLSSIESGGSVFASSGFNALKFLDLAKSGKSLGIQAFQQCIKLYWLGRKK